MKLTCSQCAKVMAVKDDLAGRKVRCPGCQNVLTVPAATSPKAVTAVLPIAPAPKSPLPIASGPPPLMDFRCPECDIRLPAGAEECDECGWVSKRTKRDRAANVGPRCYVMLTRDPLDLELAIREPVKQLLETEQLEHELSDEDPPQELGPDDLLITGKVTHHDHGSQFMRYMLTPIAIFGPGSSKLDAELTVEDGEGSLREVPIKLRQAVGFFGGTNESMMKINITSASQIAARAMAKHATGYRILNNTVYQFALASLICGVVGIIPIIGIVSGLIGLGLGVTALILISRRKLPRRKGMAIAGIVLSVLCPLLVTAALMFAA